MTGGEGYAHHFAAFLSARRTSASSDASSPSSSSAAATAMLASAGLKPRFWRAESASALWPPVGSAANPAPTAPAGMGAAPILRSEEHTSELQSLMRISYAVFCLKKKKTQKTLTAPTQT